MCLRVCRFIFNKGMWQDTGESQTLYRAANKHSISKTVYDAVLPLPAKRHSFSLRPLQIKRIVFAS